MTKHFTAPGSVHPAARMYAAEHAAGKLSRREFLVRSTALGVSATAAYGLIGMAAPGVARAQGTPGGTLRVSMETRGLKDPAPPTGARSPTSPAAGWNTWWNTTATAASAACCWKAGRRTMTRPNTR